jgi:hypothetical protein
MSGTNRDGAAIDLTAVLPLNDILPMYGTDSHVVAAFFFHGYLALGLTVSTIPLPSRMVRI